MAAFKVIGSKTDEVPYARYSLEKFVYKVSSNFTKGHRETVTSPVYHFFVGGVKCLGEVKAWAITPCKWLMNGAWIDRK